jgi:hypothetical protein
VIRHLDVIRIRQAGTGGLRQPAKKFQVKTGEKNLSSHISYFASRLSIPKFYQVHLGTTDRLYNNSRARILPWIKFCQELAMP